MMLITLPPAAFFVHKLVAKPHRVITHCMDEVLHLAHGFLHRTRNVCKRPRGQRCYHLTKTYFVASTFRLNSPHNCSSSASSAFTYAHPSQVSFAHTDDRMRHAALMC